MRQVVRNLSDKSYWDRGWTAEERDSHRHFLFREIIEQYINTTRSPLPLTYFEVGCAPGSIMAYFYHHFGCAVSGIDFAAADVTRNCLESQGVAGYQLHTQDFRTFTTKRKFSIVASFGFIEHFTETGNIIAAHQRLVAPSGYLILEVPNLRYLNWLLYRCLRPEVLAMHNLRIMNPTQLQTQVTKSGEFEILHCNYFKSTFFSFNAGNVELHRSPWLKGALLAGRRVLRVLKLENIPNRFASPYIILVARRKPYEDAGELADRSARDTLNDNEWPERNGVSLVAIAPQVKSAHLRLRSSMACLPHLH